MVSFGLWACHELMKTGFAHRISLLLLTLGLAFFSFGVADAALKIKTSVRTFHNPPDWKEPFDPAALIEKILKKTISHDPSLRLIFEPDRPPPKPEPAQDPQEKPSNEPKPSAQLWIQGKVLTFNPNSAGMSSGSNGKDEGYPEMADLEVELQVYNSRTQKTVAEKRLRVSSKEGKAAFDPSHAEFDDPAFRQTSLSAALELFGRNAVSFINSATEDSPVLADIVFVDGKKEEVIVNAGSNDGVEFLDQFPVYALRLNYADSVSQADLGEFYTRLGTIKIKDVRDNYSRAEIIAGAEIQEGSLTLAERPKAGAKPWWNFHGILALTNDYPVMLEEYQNGGSPEP